MDRKGWVDVALGALTLTGLELVWLFALRRPWALASGAAARGLDSIVPLAAVMWLLISYHSLALLLAAVLATRSLREVNQV